MTDRDRDRDLADLAALRHQLAAIDVDEPSAEQIGRRARDQLGRGLPASRFVEPVLVALATSSVLVWTVVKICEVFR